ncbi:Ig-like domain-containing protein [Shewanella gaetbuli]|uniref:Ig-like domain-containing protein n=1 Tax=Shewanella gaetbuli TaxID=220752 RepID=A0A9X1ZR89_9GAMM|nr:Ig-like domain-containing protein [Shewanella gaetbuli]
MPNVTVDANGNYSIDGVDISGLVDGDITVTATATDNNGNIVNDTDTDNLDAIEGLITVDLALNDNGATADISGTTTDVPAGSTVTLVLTDANGTQITVPNVTVDANGNYSIDGVDVSGLVDSDITVTATATDNNGNIVNDTDTDNLDAVAGSITVDLVLDDANSAADISGTTTDVPAGSTITLVLTDANGTQISVPNVTVDANGNYSIDGVDVSGLVDGDITVTATATDNNGNIVNDTDTDNLDAVAGSITVDLVLDDANSAADISGTTTDVPAGSTVTLVLTDANGTQISVPNVTVDANGNYSIDGVDVSGLVDGDITVTATATDNNGNIVNDTDTDNLDAVAGSITVDLVLDDANSAADISGTTTDVPAGSTVTLVLTDANGTQITVPNVTVDANGNYSIDGVDISGLVDGDITVTATATDNNGNTVNANDSDNLDTTAPTPLVEFIGMGSDGIYNEAEIGNDNTVTATVTLAAGTQVGDTLIVTDDNGTELFNGLVTQAMLNNGINIEVPVGSTDTEVNVTAQIIDNVGNISAIAKDNQGVDRVGPSSPSILIVDDGTPGDGFLNQDEINANGSDIQIQANVNHTDLLAGGFVNIAISIDGQPPLEFELKLDNGVLVNQDGSTPNVAFNYSNGVITWTEATPNEGQTISVEITQTDAAGNQSNSANDTAMINSVDAQNDGETGAAYSVEADFTSGPNVPTDVNGNPLFSIRALTYDSNGNLIEGNFTTINGNGIGVAGSIRADGQIATQIEYDPSTDRSEGIEITFNELVNNVEFTAARLFADENGAEQGVWKAYYNGELVASGIFSNATGSTGTFNINTGDAVFDTVVFESTNNLNPITSGDSSDYVLTSISATGAGLGEGAIVTSENDVLTVSDPATGLLANDSDQQGHNFTISSINGTAVSNGSTVQLPSGALLTIYSDGTYSYNPNNAYDSLTAGQVTQDTFTYTITDEYGATDTATVTINIIGAHDAPATSQDNVTTEEGSVLSLTDASLISNDTDPEGHSITIAAFAKDQLGTDEIDTATSGNTFTTALGGIVTINSDGTYSYQAPSNLDHSNGDVSDSFYYKATNGNADSPWTLINIDITDTAPDAINDNDSIGFGGTAYGNVITGAGTDGSGADAIGADDTELTSIVIGNTTYSTFDNNDNIVVNVNGGILTINKNGSYTFESTIVEADDQPTLTHEIFYTLTDSDGDTDQAILTITQDSMPVVADDSNNVFEAGLASGTDSTSNSNIATGNLLDNDQGISGSTSITHVNGVAATNGMVTITTALGELTVYTEDTAGHRAGDYVYTLDSNSSGNDVSETFNYRLENALNASDSGSLTINIVDDVPKTTDITQNLMTTPDPITTNITIVLDVSGSMGGGAGNGMTYLQTAVDALTSLIHEVDKTGDVNVQLVSFASGATTTGWLIDDIAEAITKLEALIADGGTNYANALSTVMNSGDLPDADQSFLYFISDGEPNSGGKVDASLQATWETYLNSGANGESLYDIAFGIGIGNAILTEILPISYPEPDGQEQYAVQVDDANDLTSTIIEYFEDNSISGSLGIINTNATDGVLIGADGGIVSSITIDGTTYQYNGVDESQAITTSLGGVFTINFITGIYNYSIDVNRNVLNQQENIEVVLTDNDGDSSNLDLVLNIDYYAGIDANTNNIITNMGSGSTIDIPVEYLTHGDRTPYDTQVTNLTGDATLNNGSVTIANATNNSTFNYEISGNGATDDTYVDVSVDNTNKLIGTAENDIIIGRTPATNDAVISATVKSGNTYDSNGNNQIGFSLATTTAGLFIASISINLRAGSDSNAEFDSSDRFAVGNKTKGISNTDSDNFVYSADNSVLTINFDANDFTNGDSLWFSVDTDSLGNDTGADFASRTVSFTVILSDGTEQTGVYISDGNNGSTGTIVFADDPFDVVLDGKNGDDILVGSEGNDLLIGGEGNDILIAGLGNDTLQGDAGNDIFVWQQGDFGSDTITDFNVTEDQLDLSDLLINEENTNLDTLLNFNFEPDGSTIIEIDSDGNGSIDQTITLDGVDLSDIYGSTDEGVIINGLLNDEALIVDTNANTNVSAQGIDPFINHPDGQIP